MPPIPTKQKNIHKKQVQRDVQASNVYDSYGRSLDYLLQSQNRTNQEQKRQGIVNRQHALQYDSSISNNKLIYRDVFPGRKYKLTLSDTSWMGGTSMVTAGYTINSMFTQIFSTAEAPEDNVFEIEIPAVQAIDSLEIRLVGAKSIVKGYIDDSTSSDSISGAIARILDSVAELISGQNSLKDDVRELKDKVKELDERVTALEQA